MSKQAQFFIVSIVLLALAFFVIFSFFISAEQSSIVMFEPSSSDDFENIANAISESNEWISSKSWWDLDWRYKKNFTISGGISNPTELDASIPAAKVSDCAKELRLVNSAGVEVDSDMKTADNCILIFTASTGEYWIYYNNSAVTQPAYRSAVASGTAPTFAVGSEQEVNPSDLCSHLKDMHLKKSIYFNCTRTLATGNSTYNYTIDFRANNFEFTGSVT